VASLSIRGISQGLGGQIRLVLAGALHHLAPLITADLEVTTDGSRATHVEEDLACCFRTRCSDERPRSPGKRMSLNVILAMVRN
jgi:hypothetical protein